MQVRIRAIEDKSTSVVVVVLTTGSLITGWVGGLGRQSIWNEIADMDVKYDGTVMNFVL